MYVTFTNTIYLFLLFLIPLVFFIHLVTLKSKKRKALRFANFEAIARIRGIDFFSKNITILFISMVILFLLVMSIAGLTLHTELEASAFSFILAIDSSQSMEADDIPPSRLAAAKKTAIEFLEATPVSTNIGIVSFYGVALIEQDVTNDKELVKRAISDIQISILGGTDLYEAVITSTNLLKGEDSRAIILLSDGQINVGGIQGSINYANDNDIIVHTVGIGTEEGGKTSYGLSKLDEDSLKALAYNTGGSFFKIQDEQGLSNSFREIMNLTKKKVSIDLSKYLIIAAIILFFIEYILINTRYKLFP